MEGNLKDHDIVDVSINDMIQQYSRYWYLFILGLLIALASAFIYLRYAQRMFPTSSVIIIKSDKNAGPVELAAFAELSYFSNALSGKIESELVILESKTLISKAIENLNLNVQYFFTGAIKTTELYKYKPFKVTFLEEIEDNSSISLEVIPLSKTSFIIKLNDQDSQTKNYGDILTFPFGKITVLPDTTNPEKYTEFINRLITVTYSKPYNVAADYGSLLDISNGGGQGEVVVLSMESTIPERSEDFIDELVNQYNQDAINDRSLIAQKTSRFINSRLEIITEELDSVERNKENFKTENRLTDIEAEAQMILQNTNEFDRRQVDLSTQLELINSMVDYMDTTEETDLLPSNIGVGGEGIAGSVSSFNQLVLERNDLMQSATNENPVVKNLTSQIKQLRGTIVQSLKNKQNSFKTSLRDLNFQEGKLNSKLLRVPAQEKLFRGIVRQQNIKEQLYLFLLQQREETNISLAVTSSKAKIVDPAFSSKNPVSPKKTIIYFMSVIVGLLVPFMLIYVYYLLSTKVTSRRDLESLARGTSILGEVPKLGRNEVDLVQENDHSILAESFRILRTNLQYLLLNKKNSSEISKRIFVTSTIKGEGKTFVAFNLALTLAATGKKVVLIGADIRNPQLQRYLPASMKNKVGLTEYIVEDHLKISDLATESEFNKNLDLVLSGAIPPNPAELLLNSRVNDFFEEITPLYDYVIVDTAPSMLVTDTILLNGFADNILYVIRAGYTDKKLLEFPRDTMEDGRLSNVSFVLNNVKMSNFGYGNKYGYTYTAQKKSFWQRLLNK